MVSDAVLARLALAAAMNETVPGPVRVAGPLSVSHDGVPPTDHVHALPVFTVNGARLPPPLVVDCVVGVTSYVHVPPAGVHRIDGLQALRDRLVPSPAAPASPTGSTTDT